MNAYLLVKPCGCVVVAISSDDGRVMTDMVEEFAGAIREEGCKLERLSLEDAKQRFSDTYPCECAP